MRHFQPTPESVPQRVLRRLGWAVRDRWPSRPVVRTVQGVQMTLPWAHRLPDYARVGPEYGQNLVRLARLLSDGHEPLKVLDVGANVGDSALQILDATDARILCVEADEFYLGFLDRNVGGDHRVTVEATLLTPTTESADVEMTPVRVGGTTRFEPGASSQSVPMLSTAALHDRHPEFKNLRLAKSDTDGYDVTLVPAIAEAWSASRPVLFFEYDHVLSRRAGNEPLAVWGRLESLGYRHIGIWDNGGHPVARAEIAEAAELARTWDDPDSARPERYWDIAAVHDQDTAGLAALTELIMNP